MTDPRPILQLSPGFHATLTLPGSKSITNRALLCAALAKGTSTLTGVLFADDTEAMLACLSALGVEVTPDREHSTVTVNGCDGRFPVSDAKLDARQSGTTSRFLLAASTLSNGVVTIDGDAQLRARPFDDGIAALEQVGVTIDSVGGSIPLRVGAKRPGTVDIRVSGAVSSQFLSGIMLAAPCWDSGAQIQVAGELQSRPYVEMTCAVMRAFGADIQASEAMDRWIVAPGGYVATDYHIEPDASAASYFFAAAAVCGGTVRVERLGAESLQGDLGFVEVLREVGAEVEISSHWTEVRGGHQLYGRRVDMSAISDTAQTLAAIAPFFEGPTTIEGIGFIRRKETDRIAAVVNELRRCGIQASAQPDGISITPGTPGPVVFDTYGDHRMAMSVAVLAAKAGGCAIADPTCVNKTFPEFWSIFDLLGVTS